MASIEQLLGHSNQDLARLVNDNNGQGLLDYINSLDILEPIVDVKVEHAFNQKQATEKLTKSGKKRKLTDDEEIERIEGMLKELENN